MRLRGTFEERKYVDTTEFVSRFTVFTLPRLPDARRPPRPTSPRPPPAGPHLRGFGAKLPRRRYRLVGEQPAPPLPPPPPRGPLFAIGPEPRGPAPVPRPAHGVRRARR